MTRQLKNLSMISDQTIENKLRLPRSSEGAVGDSDTLGTHLVLVGVPDQLRARLQRRSH